MARAPVSKTGGCGFEFLPLLPGGEFPVVQAAKSRAKPAGGDYIAGALETELDRPT